jgi:type IV secretory pathway TraG/TraD family ATPase VirD4
LTKGRKHGLRVVACLQSTSQLTDIYGKSTSETLRSCFRSLLALGGSATDPDTAEALSVGLGETEIEDREVSVSRDGQRRSTSESKQVRKRRLVLPSEIQNLVVNTGFLKLAGEFPVALIEVKPPELPNVHPAFEEK